MQRFTRSDRPSIKDIRQTFSKRPVFFHCCELENGPHYVGLGKGFCHSKFTGFWSEFRQLNFWQAWMYQLSSWNQYKGWSFFFLFFFLFVQGNRTQAIIQISTITQQKHGTKYKFHFYPFENFYNVEITCRWNRWAGRTQYTFHNKKCKLNHLDWWVLIIFLFYFFKPKTPSNLQYYTFWHGQLTRWPDKHKCCHYMIIITIIVLHTHT